MPFDLIYRLATFCLVSCVTMRTEAAVVPTNFDAIDAYLQTNLQRAGIPGGALVIVSRERIVHMQSYGVSGSQGRKPTPHTVFQIGSNSKSFTALAIMQLVETGRLQLDAPVERYLPWFHTADPHASAHITIRHLLHQTSGLSQMEGQVDFATDISSSDRAAWSGQTLERRVRALSKVQLVSEPGTRWAYSNMNSVVLGCLIESISGKPYARYMDEHVFGPLAMHNTLASSHLPPAVDLATAHRFWFGKAIAATDLPYPEVLVPAGYIYSSSQDMGAYLIAHLNGGAGTLDTVRTAELHRAGLNTGSRYGYAMGWATDEKQPGLLSHEGLTPGYSSAMAINVQQGWGYALLLNASDAMRGPVVLELNLELTKFMQGDQPNPLMPRADWPPALIGLAALLLMQMTMGIWLLRMRAQSTRIRQTPLRLVAFAWPIGAAALAVTLTIVIPRMQEINLSGMLLFAPDAGWLAVVNAALALSLGVLGSLRWREKKGRSR